MASFAWYQYQQAEIKKQSEKKKDLIFSDWSASEVQEIQIQNPTKKTIHIIQKPNTLWYLESPLKDLANASAVLDWIQNVLAEKANILKMGDTINWSEYGLIDNVRQVQLKSKSKNIELKISHYSAFDGSFFLKKNKELLLGSTAWASLTEKPIAILRSYQVINRTNRPLSIRYKSKEFNATFKWEQHGWQWSESTPLEKKFSISEPELEAYWSELSEIKFEEKNIYPKTKAYLKKYDLLKPILQLNMEFPDNEMWSAKFSKKANLFYVSVSTRDWIFTLKPSTMENILLSEEKIRDHKKPFAFNPNQVGFMKIKSKDINLHFKKEKDKWVLFTIIGTNTIKDQTKNTKEQALLKFLSQEPAIQALDRILNLSVNKYLKVKHFKPAYTLTLKDKDKALLLELKFSEPFKKEGKNQVYVQSNKERQTITIQSEELKNLLSPKSADNENKKTN